MKQKMTVLALALTFAFNANAKGSEEMRQTAIVEKVQTINMLVRQLEQTSNPNNA